MIFERIAPEQHDTLDGVPEPAETARLVGHATATGMLANAYRAGKLPHALIFAGPLGIGKATLYRKITGDEMGAPASIAGGALYGGVFGGHLESDDNSSERLVFDRDFDGQYDDLVLTSTGADAFSPGSCDGTPSRPATSRPRRRLPAAPPARRRRPATRCPAAAATTPPRRSSPRAR